MALRPLKLSSLPYIKQSYLDNLNKCIQGTSSKSTSFPSTLHNYGGVIIFIIGKSNKASIQCIRALFALHSEQLTKLLYTDDPQTKRKTIDLTRIGLKISARSFSIIQRWCYGLYAFINLHSVIEIFIFSDLFCLNDLKKLCYEYLDYLCKSDKNLYFKQCSWLLSQIEVCNFFKFIPFELFNKLVLSNPRICKKLSCEELWILCIRFAATHKNLDCLFNKSEKTETINIADSDFLKQCMLKFKFEVFNVSFLIKYVIPFKVLRDDQIIHLLSNHINSITLMANRYFSNTLLAKDKGLFNLHCFRSYKYERVCDEKYFSKTSEFGKYEWNKTKKIKAFDQKLSVFKLYFDESPYQKLILHGDKMNDVIFEIVYDEKTDDRMNLNDVFCQKDDDEKYYEPIQRMYPSIFSLFALQSDVFKQMMNGNSNKKNQIIKIDKMRASTFKFLRNWFYGDTEAEIFAYNVLDLFCVSITYKLEVLKEACFEYFSNFDLYNLSNSQLLQFILCLDSFSQNYDDVHLISSIFERCPRFAVKRKFESNQIKFLLAHQSLYKMSLSGFEDFIFETHKFDDVPKEDLFVAFVRFAKQKNDKFEIALKRLLKPSIFSFAKCLNFEHLMKGTKEIDLNSFRGLTLLTKMYDVALMKYTRQMRQRKIAKFVIFDERCIQLYDNEQRIVCRKRDDLKSQYLLCLSGDGYLSGFHVFKYRMLLIDGFAAIGICSMCNKEIKNGYGLYDKLGVSEEAEGELLGGSLVSVWSDGALLKYVDGECIVNNQKSSRWNDGDVITCILDFKNLEVQFNKNENIIGCTVKLEKDVAYFPVVQCHSRSNHNIHLFDQRHSS